jgi:hypothetical protein
MPYREKLTEEEREHLLHAFRTAMRSFSRILVDSGVPYWEFREILKETFVEAAMTGLVEEGETEVTPQRLAHVSGIPEKEAVHLLEVIDQRKAPNPTEHDLIGAVVTKWVTDQRYLGPYGLPKILPVSSNSGPSLGTLVDELDLEVSHSKILELLVSTKVAEIADHNSLRFISRTPSWKSLKVIYELMGRTIGDIADTTNYNIRSAEIVKRTQMVVFSDNPFPESGVQVLRGKVSKVVREVIGQVDNWMVEAGTAAEATLAVGVHFIMYERREAPGGRQLSKYLQKGTGRAHA